MNQDTRILFTDRAEDSTQCVTDTVAEPEITDSRSLNLYEKREKIYTRKIEGRFQNIRLFTGWPLLIGYFACPWFTISGHQAILFDLPARKFHIFWLTFWPQDFFLLGLVLIVAAFALFAVTTLAGRVWCGYTCPQTVWTAIFMWIEQVAEGDRNQRMKLDRQPLNLTKVGKRTLKHGLWLGVGAATGITFVSYFYGMRSLLVDLYNLQLPLGVAFWTALFTFGTYINAGWMREQVCKYMCPYARFQSAMFDDDTLIVSYDERRGERRGARKRNQNPSGIGLGDCIDCQMCVQVCPTGIDIRDGLQYECINCALCIDACDGIMDKMGYERGLISYTTLNRLSGLGWTLKRPKLIGYTAALLIFVTAFSIYLWGRVPLQLDIDRTRGELFREVSGGLIKNSYGLKIINMDDVEHLYTISVTGLDRYELVLSGEPRVPAGTIVSVAADVIVNPDALGGANNEIRFHIESMDGRLSTTTESRFIGPMPPGLSP
ncbi:MAG: cytochrome c oxidase accessory protein CcoG [Proteobacteria bacterium]|jgi:cytochrome c oxidase accessory protein FixG|nr:cytochrome c oxidase accessory protein CcoG [Pseudomonadota bacterium]